MAAVGLAGEAVLTTTGSNVMICAILLTSKSRPSVGSHLRQVVSSVVAQKLLDIKLFTHADFARTLMAVRAHRERLVVAVGRLKEDRRGVVDTALPAADVRQHRIAEHDRANARIRRKVEPRRTDEPASRDHNAVVKQVGASRTLVIGAYFRARGVAGERVLEMESCRRVQTVGKGPQVDRHGQAGRRTGRDDRRRNLSFGDRDAFQPAA